jgi:SAM-dependent methyltransferase
MKLDQLLRKPYQPSDRRFQEGMRYACATAAAITPFVLDVFPVRSMIDVGCGAGVLLAAFAERGVERIVGVDGDYTNHARLQFDPKHFVAWDLNQPLGPLGLGRFDLALSVEVGEHLSPSRADSFVDDLCALADVVLYGAAIVQQGGINHINEQWQSYWARKFLSRDYIPYDLLRPVIWNTRDVPYWYKQNTLFYVKRGSPSHDHFESRFPGAAVTLLDMAMLDIVHPDLYSMHVEKKRGLRRLQKNVKRYVLQFTGRQSKRQAPVSSRMKES